MHKTGTRAFPNCFKIPNASRPQHVCVTGYLSGESKEKKKSAQGDEEEEEEGRTVCLAVNSSTDMNFARGRSLWKLPCDGIRGLSVLLRAYIACISKNQRFSRPTPINNMSTWLELRNLCHIVCASDLATLPVTKTCWSFARNIINLTKYSIFKKIEFYGLSTHSDHYNNIIKTGFNSMLMHN